MGVFFEEYSKKPSQVIRQGAALARCVKRESWLEFARPSVSAKYTGFLKATGHAWEEAWNQNEYHQSRILRAGGEQGPVIGQSMITLERTVWHPQEGKFQGTLISYWLAANTSKEMHREVAEGLISASGALALRQDAQAEKISVFTIVSRGDVWPPRGLELALEPVGDPATLAVPPEMRDLYDAPNGVRFLQLYFGHIEMG